MNRYKEGMLQGLKDMAVSEITEQRLESVKPGEPMIIEGEVTDADTGAPVGKVSVKFEYYVAPINH
jgi:hypothetical protein